MASQVAQTIAGEEYTIRPYRSGDLQAFLDLDTVVWDREQSPEWFRWKYISNPFVDFVPIVVAEQDGEIVGSRPFMVFELRAGESTFIGYQPADTSVHPDHRRNGIFSSMTEFALTEYAGTEPDFYFNYPNEYARPGYESLGWHTVSPAVTHFLLRSTTGYGNGSLASKIGKTLLNPALTLRQQFRSKRTSVNSAVSVRRIEGVPYKRLATLYRRNIPTAFHAHRSEQFLRWRLSSPVWSRETYFAASDSCTVAVVIRTRTLTNGAVLTQIVDVLPFSGDDRWQMALKGAVKRVITDHQQTDLFATVGNTLPKELLNAFGFMSNDRLPLSYFSRYSTALVTRPNGDPADENAWRYGNRPIDDPTQWRQTFIEWDTS
ncbi:GNAT family N-acetyltransferase [Halorubraceae archaeon YAN]|nr:GNAT family N-acetyltransferase [Halorubraceae archaeon YAN]